MKFVCAALGDNTYHRPVVAPELRHIAVCDHPKLLCGIGINWRNAVCGKLDIIDLGAVQPKIVIFLTPAVRREPSAAAIGRIHSAG